MDATTSTVRVRAALALGLALATAGASGCARGTFMPAGVAAEDDGDGGGSSFGAVQPSSYQGAGGGGGAGGALGTGGGVTTSTSTGTTTTTTTSTSTSTSTSTTTTTDSHVQPDAGPPGACDAQGDCQSCFACAQNTECLNEQNACFNDADCVALANCLGACQDPNCAQGCAGAHPTGMSLYDTAVTCLMCTACPQSCAGQGGGC
jgi:hypothetical protein